MKHRIPLKIKNFSLVVEIPYDGWSEDIVAYLKGHSDWIKKLWTPLVGALEATGALEEEVLIRCIQETVSWDPAYCSKKAMTLARKHLRGNIESSLTEQRYSLKEAKEAGLIEKTLEDYEQEQHPLWQKCLLGAIGELGPLELFDPMPMEMAGYLKLAKEWETQDDQ